MLRTILICALVGASTLSAQEQGPPPGVEAERPSLEKRLAELTVDLHGDMTVGEALAFLTDVTELPFVLGHLAAADAEVTVQGQGVSLSQLLDTLCAAAKPTLEWGVVDGVVVHLRKKGAPLPARPKLEPAWLKDLGARKLSVNFDPPVELRDAAQLLEELFLLHLDVPEALAEKPVQVRARDLPYPTLLTLIADQVGATWRMKGHGAAFVPREAKK
ncbi:MAG: hypothetical protein R3F62_28680 [Planctomycetota bacterium]